MNNEPAFPGNWKEVHHTPGMTLRDYFAAKAISGILSDPNIAFSGILSDPNIALSSEKLAEWSYRVADAMLEARNK